MVEIIIGSIAVGDRLLDSSIQEILVGCGFPLVYQEGRKKGFVQPVPSSTAKMSQEER
nr:hypothetical protein Iba_chr12bCG25760 [Ipomoea batatas]